MTRAAAALARHASEMPEQPALVYVDARGHWKWRSWRWLRDEVGTYAARVAAEPEWRPTVEGLVEVLAREAATEGMVRGAHPTGSGDASDSHSTADEGAGRVRIAHHPLLARPLAEGERPVVPIVHEPADPHAAAWLLWALEAGAALVLPGDEAFLAWAIWWPRATDVAVRGDELASLRELLTSFGSRRAQRRHLARLRRVIVWDEAPSYAERAWWEDVGVALQPFDVNPAG